jgi:hypothetical protein
MMKHPFKLLFTAGIIALSACNLNDKPSAKSQADQLTDSLLHEMEASIDSVITAAEVGAETEIEAADHNAD